MNIHNKPNRGITNEWYTPPEILEQLQPFDDDPALPGKTDGLDRPWNGFVWLNPPYGPEVGLWLRKLAEHGNGIAIVFARTETKWFISEVWQKATSLCFIHGRPHFYREGVRAKGNCGGPMVLVGYGSEADRRLKACSLGTFVQSWAASQVEAPEQGEAA